METFSELNLEDIQSAQSVVEINIRSKPVNLDTQANVFTFECPNCDMFVEVEKNQINCGIFRHAYFFRKDIYGNINLIAQLNPHTPKSVCDRLLAEGSIIGCGKPFRLTCTGNLYVAQTCNYI